MLLFFVYCIYSMINYFVVKSKFQKTGYSELVDKYYTWEEMYNNLLDLNKRAKRIKQELEQDSEPPYEDGLNLELKFIEETKLTYSQAANKVMDDMKMVDIDSLMNDKYIKAWDEIGYDGVTVKLKRIKLATKYMRPIKRFDVLMEI